MHCSTLTSVAGVICRTLESYRVDPNELLLQVGLQPELLEDANARYPISRMQALWTLAAQRTQDPCFGLSTLEYWQPTSLHALGYAWMASTTLADALQRLERYAHLVASSARIRIQHTGREVAIIYTAEDASAEYVDVSLDAALSLLLKLLRLLLGRDFSPLGVHLTRPEPACRQRFYAVFCAPIQFAAQQNRLLLDAALLQQPLPGANAMLARANEQLIHDYLVRFGQTSLAMLVRAALVEMLPTGHVSEEQVAQKMHMSVRSLQRRLREEGGSFKQILDDMRRDLAKDYVSSSGYSVNEIAYLLGFSEPGNFTRAFKRWNGVPPSQYMPGN